MASRGTSSVGFALAKVLRDRIAGGRYTNNFPTENELMAEFAMSRYAVRSALQRLETDGQIRRHPGRGTMLVERFSEGSTWAIRTVEDLIVQIERIHKIRAHRVRQDIAGGSAAGRVARQLNVAPGHPTVVIRRTYFGWDREVIVVGELHYRLDGFRQTIDLFRENLPAP